MTSEPVDYCANKNSNDDFGNNNAIMQSQKRKVIKGRTAKVAGMIIITALQSTMNMLNSPSSKFQVPSRTEENILWSHATWWHMPHPPEAEKKEQKIHRHDLSSSPGRSLSRICATPPLPSLALSHSAQIPYIIRTQAES